MIDASRALIRKEAAKRVYFGVRLSSGFWRMVPRKLMTQWYTSRDEIGKGEQKCHFFDDTVESGWKFHFFVKLEKSREVTYFVVKLEKWVNFFEV